MGWFDGSFLAPSSRVPGNYEVVQVGLTALGLSTLKILPKSGPYAGKSAYAAIISVEGGDIRFRLDGGNPSASDGHYLTSSDGLVLTSTQVLKQLRVVQAGEVGATLRVTYFY